MGATRPASGQRQELNTNATTANNSCIFSRRETRRPHQCLRLVVAFGACIQWQWYLLPYYYNLHTEYLASYTNTLQLIDYQCFIQCKMPTILPTRILHTLHAATRHTHGRITSRHRGTEKSVAPTDCSTSLCRIIYCIRQNQLWGSGVGSVRCMQGCVRYFEIILHS